MKHAQGNIDPALIKAMKDGYDSGAQSFSESYDFKTCQRSDGTTYGTAGDCAQKGSKEVKKGSKKSSWDPGDNLAGTMGTEITKIASGCSGLRGSAYTACFRKMLAGSYPDQIPTYGRNSKTSSASSNSSNDKNRFPTPEEYKNKKQQGGKASVVVPNWLLKSTAWKQGDSTYVGDGNGGRIPMGEYQLQEMIGKYASMDKKGRAQWKQWYDTAAAQAKRGQIPKNPYAGVWTAADERRGSRVISGKEKEWANSPAGQLRNKLVREDSKNWWSVIHPNPEQVKWSAAANLRFIQKNYGWGSDEYMAAYDRAVKAGVTPGYLLNGGGR